METNEAVVALAALAHESRLAIFRYLVKAGPEGRLAGQIAEEFGMPASTLSHHLNQLRLAGLIVRRRESRTLNYAISIEKTAELTGYLQQECCDGRPELCFPGTAASGPAADACCGPRKAAE